MAIEQILQLSIFHGMSFFFLFFFYAGFDCHCPNQSTGGICRAGTYCPAGASEPVTCDPGKEHITSGIFNMISNCTLIIGNVSYIF